MAERQLLHLVLGGELKDLKRNEFKNPDKIHVVGVFPSYAAAHEAWQAAARATVDNAHMRYFIVHIHRLLDPRTEKPAAPARRKAAKKTARAKR